MLDVACIPCLIVVDPLDWYVRQLIATMAQEMAECQIFAMRLSYKTDGYFLYWAMVVLRRQLEEAARRRVRTTLIWSSVSGIVAEDSSQVVEGSLQVRALYLSKAMGRPVFLASPSRTLQLQPAALRENRPRRRTPMASWVQAS